MAQKKAKTAHNGGEQLPLLTPDSAWQRPAELPDLRRVRRVALDRETKDRGLETEWGPGWVRGRTETGPEANYVCGTSVAWRADGGALRTAYFPVRHPDTDNFDPEQVAQWERDHQAAGVEFVTHNGPYDAGWGTTDGVPVPPRLHDTVVAANMVDEQRPSYELNVLCADLGIPGKDEALLREALAAYGYPSAGKKAKQYIHKLPARYVGPYAEQDAGGTYQLFEILEPELDAQDLREAYQLEIDLIPLVHEMRRRGIRVDEEAAERAILTFREMRQTALDDLTARIGTTTTIEDLRRNLWLDEHFTRAKLSFPKNNDGRGSFEAVWMRRVDHWLPQLVCRATQADRMAETFLKTHVLGYAWRGRLHASINQFRGEDGGGTRTFRFSYSDPPLQQMPKRNEVAAKLVRGVFLPEEGEWWFGPDYCYDAETEVLTERGWVKFPELGDEKVAQWHEKDGKIDFAAPLDKYVGPLRERCMVEVKSKRTDLYVTEKHRVLLQHQVTGKYRVVLACELTEDLFDRKKGGFWEIPTQTSVRTGADAAASDDLLRLVLACQADAQDRATYGGSTWVFYLKKPHKIARLVQILNSLKVEYRIRSVGKHGRTSVRFSDFPALREWFVPGEKRVFAYEKFQVLSLRQKRLVIEELKEWDGSEHPHSLRYGSECKCNVDTMCAIAVQAGYVTQAWLAKWTKVGRKPFYQIRFRGEYERGVRGGTQVRFIKEKCRVYCVTTSTGFVVVRRNGVVQLSGNSQQEYRLIVHFANRLGLRRADVAARAYADDPRTDFHALVASLTGLERKPAKDTNFAKSYGAGKEKFAAMIGKPVEEAAAIMGQYDAEMPFVRELFELCENNAQAYGYVLLLDKARIHFDTWEPRWLSREERARGWGSGGRYKMHACGREEAMQRAAQKDHPWHGKRLRRADCRKAMNAKIQGCAARMTKMAMRECWRAGHVPSIQMHDELGFSVHSEEQGVAIAGIMRNVVKLTVPFLVDAEYGNSWGDAVHSWDERGPAAE